MRHGNIDEERARITVLLPRKLKNKVTSPELAEEAYQWINVQMDRVTTSLAEINPLYNFLNSYLSEDEAPIGRITNERGIAIRGVYGLLPDEIFAHIGIKIFTL